MGNESGVSTILPPRRFSSIRDANGHQKKDLVTAGKTAQVSPNGQRVWNGGVERHIRANVLVAYGPDSLRTQAEKVLERGSQFRSGPFQSQRA